MGGSQVPHTRKVCPFAKQLCQFYLSLLLLLKWNEGGGGGCSASVGLPHTLVPTLPPRRLLYSM